MDNIMHILHNNGYNPSVIDVIQRQKQSPRQPQDTGKQKWARFTYSGKATRSVTKFFQQAGIRIAHSTKKNWETSYGENQLIIIIYRLRAAYTNLHARPVGRRTPDRKEDPSKPASVSINRTIRTCTGNRNMPNTF